MHHWIKRLFAAAAPLLLTSCLWGPGKFASDLTIRKDGGFVLDYRGELVLQVPEDESTQPWTNAKAKCTEGTKARACTAAEIADQKAAYEKKRQALRFILQSQARHLALFLRNDRTAYEPFVAGW